MIRTTSARERHRHSRFTQLASLAIALAACMATMVATSSIGLAADKDHDKRTITAQDFHFGNVPKSVEAGTFNFTFKNKTPDSPHVIAFARIASNEARDATTKDVIAAVDAQDVCPKGCFFSQFGDVVFADPSTTVPGQAHLSKGTWGYVCFITEADGTPHYHLGMVGLLKVTGDK